MTHSRDDMFHWTYNLPKGHFCILFQQLLCECSYLTISEALAQTPLQETDLMDGPFMQESFGQ